MDIASCMKTEVLRPLTTLVVPSSVAVAPYILVTAYYFPATETFWGTHSIAFTAVVGVLVLAVGLILEDLGEHIEELWDFVLKDEKRDPTDNWKKYLKLSIGDEYVAERYLRTIVARMKFELPMCPALLTFIIGLVWLDYLHDLWSARSIIELVVFLVIVLIYLLRQSYESARLLDDLHKHILDAVQADKQPSGDQQ
jgi:hypothetical protein